MPEYQEIKDQARAKARSLLAHSQSFRNMEREEQMSLYKDLVDAQYNDLAEAQGLSTAMATAGDLIDEGRHQNQRIGRAGQTTADILSDTVKKVDFPGFVKDLLNGVFDANLNANIKQMEAFQNLLKSATQSLSQFVNAIDDNEAMMRLVEGNNQYKLKMTKAQARGGGRGGRRNSKGGSDKGGEQKAVLLDQSGKEVNMNDSAIQAKILDAKLAMAKERRTMLRETILMGVSRLVVEKGIIRASVKFKIDAYEDTVNYDEAEVVRSKASRAGGSFFGLFGGGISHSETRISVADSSTEMGSESSTEMEGFVEIQFKSDYFKLDNFKESFDLGAGQLPQAQVPPGTAPAQQLPAAPVAQ